MSRPVLIADIGATTSRLGLTKADGKPFAVRTVPNDRIADLPTLLSEALEAARRPRPQAAVLGVAGPVDGDRFLVTNRQWSFSTRELARRLELKRMIVLNDFAALAHALPALAPADLVPVGARLPIPRDRLFVCGPGTGFGSALLLAAGRRPQVLASEAGHMRLGAANAEEARVIGHLLRETGPVIVEQVLSGSGLARVHAVLTGQRIPSEAVASAARVGNPAARNTTDFFLRIYGRIAGDLALAYNAQAVFLAGGVTEGLAPLIANSPFRTAFEEHAPYEDRMALIPVNIIARELPGLLGAAQLARALA
jgi:glucokinase